MHFIPHGLIQSIDATTVKHQLTQQNRFLAQTGIVTIFNITEDSMNAGTNNGIKIPTCHTISNWYRIHVFDRIFRQMASIS